MVHASNVRNVSVVCVTIFILCVGRESYGWQEGEKKRENNNTAAFGTPPLIRLIRDPFTQTDLKLTTAQAKSIAALLEKVDAPLWRLRDYPIDKVTAKAKPLVTSFELGLEKILDIPQSTRLKQIVRQVHSWRGIVEPEMASELSLTAEQQKKLKLIFEESTQHQAVLQEGLKKANGKPTDALQQSLRQSQEQEREQVAKVLDSSQQKKLVELIGPNFDFGKLSHLWTKAPEFASTTEWRQSKPLKISEQRGKVVIVHFFAFGCINCVHNYPWYREWEEKYPRSEVTIVGIHTPETTEEQSITTLERKLKQNKLGFPVAVDNDKANWDAWGNTMWPSVYIVDKEGFVRTWWYGELDWQGAGGQKIMEQKIDALLKETPR